MYRSFAFTVPDSHITYIRFGSVKAVTQSPSQFNDIPPVWTAAVKFKCDLGMCD